MSKTEGCVGNAESAVEGDAVGMCVNSIFGVLIKSTNLHYS